MSTTLNILFIHGIGWGKTGPRYARPLQNMIGYEFDRAVRRLPGIDTKAARADKALRFEAACWDSVTQRPQDSLLRVMFGGAWLRRFSLTYQFRRNLVALLGDVTAYERDPRNSVYQAIHAEIDKSMDTLSRAAATDHTGDAPLTVIGYSLGSVIASDYIWDHAGSSYRLSGHNFSLANVFTLGSPMAIYALRDNPGGGPASIQASLPCPIQVDPDGGMWVNFYDRQDPFAFPLEPIDSYRAAGVIDCEVHTGNWLTGWNMGSHAGYWRCDDLARIIGQKLALDWARLNSSRFAGPDYDKALDRLRRELHRH